VATRHRLPVDEGLQQWMRMRCAAHAFVTLRWPTLLTG
jgi:hypothetical protein